MKWLLGLLVLILFSMTQLGSKKADNSNDSNILPTNLAYFSVQQWGHDFQLTWATTSEQKDTRIELQKSFNERQFETLAVFKGADRRTQKAYMYADTTPFERTVHEVKVIYYRLKVIDDNQTFTYSKTLSIVRENEGETNPTF